MTENQNSASDSKSLGNDSDALEDSSKKEISTNEEQFEGARIENETEDGSSPSFSSPSAEFHTPKANLTPMHLNFITPSSNFDSEFVRNSSSDQSTIVNDTEEVVADNAIDAGGELGSMNHEEAKSPEEHMENWKIHSDDRLLQYSPVNDVTQLPSLDVGNMTIETVVDDGSKEESFEDAKDELITSEAYSVVEESDTAEKQSVAESGPENHVGLEIASKDIGVEEHKVMDELDYLRHELAKTVNEKELFLKELEEFKANMNSYMANTSVVMNENGKISTDLAEIHHQLGMLSDEVSHFNESSEGLVNRLREAEKGDIGAQRLLNDSSTFSMVHDCSRYIANLRSSLNEKSQHESTIRELHAILYSKDQEIEGLNAKLLEQEVHSRSFRDNQFNWESYMEVFSNNLLVSLADHVVPNEVGLTVSVTDRMGVIEKRVLAVIEEQKEMLSLVANLANCVDVVCGTEAAHEKTPGFIIPKACETLLEMKTKGDELSKEVGQLHTSVNEIEEVKRKLREELDTVKAELEVSDSKRQKAQKDYEELEIKLVSSKEKLSMAVTKGKSLVQQREALKHSLSEKSEELEKCLAELQQKATDLDSTEKMHQERIKVMEEEIADCQNLIASLENSLSLKNVSLKKIEEILYEVSAPEEVQAQGLVEQVQWIAGQKCLLDSQSTGQSSVIEKVKATLSSCELPDSVSSMEIEDQIGWIGKSLSQAKEELVQLQDKLKENEVVSERYISEILEARKDIDELHKQLSEEKQGRVSLLDELNNSQDHKSELLEAHKEIGNLQKDLMLEKQGRVSIQEELNNLQGHMSELLEAHKEIDDLHKDLMEEKYANVVIQLELKNLIERLENEAIAAQNECKKLGTTLSEERQAATLLQAELENLISKHKDINEQATVVLSERNEYLKRLLELSDEKIDHEDTLVFSKDANTIAERCFQKIAEAIGDSSSNMNVELQRLQSLLDAKGQELDRCKTDLDDATSNDSNLKSELSTLLDTHKKLVAEMEALKVEKDLLQSNLEKVEEKSALLREKLSLAVKKGKGLVQEKENLKHSIDGKNAEIEKLSLDLQGHEAALSECQNQINELKRDLACIPKIESAMTEANSQKDQMEKLLQEVNAMLHKVMSSLERISLPTTVSIKDPIQRVEFLSEYIHDLQVSKENLSDDLKKAKEEFDSQGLQLADALASIRRLEDTLREEESNLSMLSNQKSESESAHQLHVADLENKLSASREQLSQTQSRLEKQTSELRRQLSLVQNMRGSSKATLHLISEKFSKNSEHLTKVTVSVQELLKLLSQQNVFGVPEEHVSLLTHDQPEFDYQSGPFIHQSSEAPDFGDLPNDMAKDMIDDNVILSNITTYLQRSNMDIQLVSDKIEAYSSSLDYQIESLAHVLQTTQKQISDILEHVDSLKQNVTNLEASHMTDEATISALKTNASYLLRACSNATQELKKIGSHNLLDANRTSYSTDFDLGLADNDRDAKENSSYIADSLKCSETAEGLISTAKDVCSKVWALENLMSERSNVGEEMKQKIQEIELMAETAMKERDTHQANVNQLKSEIDAIRLSCTEMKLRLEDYERREGDMTEKELMLSSLQEALLVKEQATYHLMPEDQERILQKVEQIDIDYLPGMHGLRKTPSDPVEKLFSIISGFTELQERIQISAQTEEDMNSLITSQSNEIAQLKKDAERLLYNFQELEKKNVDFTELISGVDQIIQKFGDNEFLVEKNAVGTKESLQVLEKLVTEVVSESEKSKSKCIELGANLRNAQNVIDELSEKVKLLEVSILDASAAPYVVQERNMFMPSASTNGSEISEVEDKAVLVKSISSTSPASLRTMYKGSSEHLALNIDTESDRLLDQHNDDDKGHVFKSLNTTGLVPKQGKQLADRLDGFWVSGGRILMRRPGARIGLIAYSLILHFWVLATVL